MSDPVRIQIYTAQSPEEAVALADLGVDHVGVTPSRRGLPGEVDDAAARAICAAVSGSATSVALTVETDPGPILAMVRAVAPDVLHLCGPSGELGPRAVADLRRSLGETRVMQAIAVTGPQAVDLARSYERAVDYLLLDSVAPGIPGIGAAGQVHDWDLSAEIVETVGVPVILAGGLSPENVADAIAAVRPWGVDSLTHTNRALSDGGFRKDLDRVRAFVETARGSSR